MKKLIIPLILIISILLASQVFAAYGDYERPKIKTIMDKPILNGRTVDVTPTGEKAWVSNEARANSNAFKKPNANVNLSKTVALKTKTVQVLNSDVARAAYKPTTNTFVGGIQGGPTIFKLNTGKVRRTKESIATSTAKNKFAQPLAMNQRLGSN